MKWRKGHQARTASPCLLPVEVSTGDSRDHKSRKPPWNRQQNPGDDQILSLELRLGLHHYQAGRTKPDWKFSFCFLNSFCLKALMRWRRVWNFPLGPLFFGLFSMLLVFKEQANFSPLSYRLYFFNPCFVQCIPVRDVSCKRSVLDHPVLHKPQLVERKSIWARNVLTVAAGSPIRGCVLCWGFSTGSACSSFSAGCVFPQRLVSEGPFSLFSHSGKENG